MPFSVYIPWQRISVNPGVQLCLCSVWQKSCVLQAPLVTPHFIDNGVCRSTQSGTRRIGNAILKVNWLIGNGTLFNTPWERRAHTPASTDAFCYKVVRIRIASLYHECKRLMRLRHGACPDCLCGHMCPRSKGRMAD